MINGVSWFDLPPNPLQIEVAQTSTGWHVTLSFAEENKEEDFSRYAGVHEDIFNYIIAPIDSAPNAKMFTQVCMVLHDQEQGFAAGGYSRETLKQHIRMFINEKYLGAEEGPRYVI